MSMPQAGAQGTPGAMLIWQFMPASAGWATRRTAKNAITIWKARFILFNEGIGLKRVRL